MKLKKKNLTFAVIFALVLLSIQVMAIAHPNTETDL